MSPSVNKSHNTNDLLHNGFGFSPEKILGRARLQIADKTQNISSQAMTEKKIPLNDSEIKINSEKVISPEKPLPSEKIPKPEKNIYPEKIFEEEALPFTSAGKIKTQTNINSINEKKINPINPPSSSQLNNLLTSEPNVPRFLSFLAWIIDSLVGFCFFIVSLCISFIFFQNINLGITTIVTETYPLIINENVLKTFIFSIEVWFLMVLFVFIFQFTILILQNATLGRFIFGIFMENDENRQFKNKLTHKITAAFAESILLGSIFSFLFITIMPTRSPIFYWVRYNTKKR